MPILRVVVALVAFMTAVAAQCEPQWQPGDPLPHVKGTVHASLTWDPDGSGPAAPVLVVGGSSARGTVLAYDGTDWTPLGSLPCTGVTALAVYNGELIAAGYVEGFPGYAFVCRWDGTDWQGLSAAGLITGYMVRTMAVFNGSLFIGGSFSDVYGVPAANIARWDGAAWSSVGAGIVGVVHALAVFGNALHVGGEMTMAGGFPVANHAIWTGNSWLLGAYFDGPIETFAVRVGLVGSLTYLFAGGAFTVVAAPSSGTVAASHVARLTLSSGVWSAVGAGLGGTKCRRLFLRYLGAVGYELTAATDETPYMVWRWTGTAWTNVAYVVEASPFAWVTAFEWFNGQYVLGLFVGDVAVRTYDPAQGWIPLRGRGIDGPVEAQCVVGNDLVIGGAFRKISGVTMNGIARGHANAWQPLGTGIDGGAGVHALVAMPNGDLVAGGDFATAGGVQVGNIARWNGTTWAPLGLGVDGPVFALRVLPNGDLVAAGAFTLAGGAIVNHIARWNGVAWLPMGTGANGNVNALDVLPNGDLIAGGSFTQMGGLLASRLARWNGSSWSPLGAGVDDSVWAVLAMNDGGVMVGGHFTTAGGLASPFCARWNAGVWEPQGAWFGLKPTSDVLCLAQLPDGDIVAGGGVWSAGLVVPPYVQRSNLVRLDRNNGPSYWYGLDAHGSTITNLLVLPDASLSAGGAIDAAGPYVVGNLVRLVPPCPALATSSGVGCSGRTLTASVLPWVNATFRAVGTNLPTTAIVLTVTSVSPIPQGVAPLAGIFAQGVPGCDVLVAPDILGALVTTNGTATSQMFLPNTPPLVGVTFFHQMIPIAVDAQGAWTSVTATNALQLTAGIF